MGAPIRAVPQASPAPRCTRGYHRTAGGGRREPRGGSCALRGTPSSGHPRDSRAGSAASARPGPARWADSGGSAAPALRLPRPSPGNSGAATARRSRGAPPPGAAPRATPAAAAFVCAAAGGSGAGSRARPSARSVGTAAPRPGRARSPSELTVS